MTNLASAAIACVIQVTLFSIAAAILYIVARRFHAERAARIVLCSLAMIGLLTLTVWCPWPRWSLSASAGAANSNANAPPAALEQSPLMSPDFNPSIATSSPADANAPLLATWRSFLSDTWQSLGTTTTNAAPSEMPTRGLNWTQLAALCVAAAACVGLARIGVALLAVAGLRRRTMPIADETLHSQVSAIAAALRCRRPIALAETRQIGTAATVGWLRPLVLLPSNWRSWTPEERHAVLAHEVAHVARNDFLAQMVGQLVLAFHYYHPLVHWLARRLRLEQELAADAAAARVVGGPQPYMATLARLALAQPAARPAWPVHAFLPTQGMFLRRIEMLRYRNTSLPSRTSKLAGQLHGVFALCTLLAAALATAGLRAPRQAAAQTIAPQPAADQPITDPAAPPTTIVAAAAAETQTEAPRHFDVTFIPADAIGAVVVQPAALLREASWQPLVATFDEILTESLPGFSIADFREVMGALYLPNDRPPQRGPSVRIVLHVDLSVSLRERLAQPLKGYDGVDSSGRIRFIDAMGISNGRLIDDSQKSGYVVLNDETLVFDQVGELMKLVANPPRSRTVEANGPGQIYAVAKSERVKASFFSLNTLSPLYMPFAPLIDQTQEFRATADLRDPFQLTLTADCLTPEATETVAKTLEAARTLAGNVVQQQQLLMAQAAGQLPPEQGMQMNQWLDIGSKLLAEENGRIARGGQQATLTITTPLDLSGPVQGLLPAIRRAREEARQVQSMNNLRQIALAMFNFESNRRRFPAATLLGPDGTTPHSWRVAILPYLGYQQLYDRYRLNEPWDSEHNRELIKDIPPIYRHPFDDPTSTNTSYFVLTGPDTIFFNNEGTRLAQITDGTSNTILVVEAKRDIPWTKPEDIPYAADQPIPKLGGWQENNRFLFARSDGSVTTEQADQNEELLRAKITRNGGEVLPR